MEKKRFMVCPHDTAKYPERWFYLSRYLSANLGVSVRLQPALDFPDFHQHVADADIVYANPQDSLRLIAANGFRALVRPATRYDEAVFIANSNETDPGMHDCAGQRIASVTTMLVNSLALDILREQGITPAAVVDQGSWMKVVNVVSRGQFAYGFLYKDFYDELSDSSRRGIRAYYQSSRQSAFHMLLVRDTRPDLCEALNACLLAMHESAQGRAVLEQIAVTRWLSVQADDLGKLRSLAAGIDTTPRE